MELRDDLLHQARVLNTGQARVKALELEGEPVVVNAKQVQHGRMQITDVNNVAHTVTHAAGSTSHGLQVALTWMYPGVYALSCVVFVAALVFLKRDIRKAAEAKAAGKERDGAGNVLVNAAIDDYDRMDMADP